MEFITLLALTLLFLFSVVAGVLQNKRRAQSLLLGLSASTRGKVRTLQVPNRHLFLVAFEPAPEPYERFQAQCTPFSVFSLIDWVMVNRSEANQLWLQGRLVNRPLQELLWMRNRTPDRALGRGREAGLWIRHPGDFAASDFATRGANSKALEHAFFDLQARFGPFLQKVSIQGGDTWEVQIVLRVNRLNPEDLPALVTTVRALGRAALIR